MSLHLPKTAGTSFLSILEQQYGERLLRDYADRPLNHPGVRRWSRALGACLGNGAQVSRFAEVDCIHGHFLPLKYRLLAQRRPLRFVAWLRDPVERLASHFHYWQRSFNPRESGQLHRRVVEERWDLERFCLSPELQNTYHRFLWGFPLRRFDFLGITEHFDSDIKTFAARYFLQNPELDTSRPVPSINVNQQRNGPEQPQRLYVTDTAFRETVEAFHARDMALYRQVRAARALERGEADNARAAQ